MKSRQRISQLQLPFRCDNRDRLASSQFFLFLGLERALHGVAFAKVEPLCEFSVATDHHGFGFPRCAAVFGFDFSDLRLGELVRWAQIAVGRVSRGVSLVAAAGDKPTAGKQKKTTAAILFQVIMSSTTPPKLPKRSANCSTD